MAMKNIMNMTLRGMFTAVSIAVMTCLLTSCGEVYMGDTDMSRNGLLSLSLRLNGEGQVFTPTQNGPYRDGDIIEFRIPSSIESPVDLNRGSLTAGLENDCFMEVSLAGRFFDLSEPQSLRVLLPEGKVATYTIVAKRITPVCLLKKTWFKNGFDLGYEFPVWITSIAMAKEGFVVYDGVENYADSRIKVYDEEDGSLLNSINVPNTFLSQVKTDDAGHIVAARENVYGAGFMLYLYEDMNAQPRLILDYSAALGCQLMLGYRFSICGDLTSGKAYVYAMAGNIYFGAKGKEYYCWEFNDGVPVSVIPVKTDFSSQVTDCWDSSNIQRISTDQGADIYLSYYRYSENTGSRMYCIKSDTGDLSEMKSSNFEFQLLGFRVFEMQEHRFLAMLTQGNGAPTLNLKVFDITDPKKWSTMKPGDDGYSDFMIYESEPLPANNLNHWGDVAVRVDGTTACIYATVVSSDKAQSGVVKWTVNYFPPDE